MSLGVLYQRLIVAAGAVALLVVNWFCRPVRQRPLPPRQGDAAQGTLQEALLGAADNVEERADTNDSRSVEPAACKEQVFELGSEQPNDGASLAPEDIVMEAPASSDSPKPSEDSLAHPQPLTQQPAGDGAVSGAGTSDGAGSLPTAPTSAAVPRAPNNPVDEDYLKSFLDQELGPPKFAVPKEQPRPNPESQPPDDRSLQELLDQAFGPPKFAVPKQPSPPPVQPVAPAPAAAAPPASAADSVNQVEAATVAAGEPQPEEPEVSAPAAPAARRSQSGGMKRSHEEEVPEAGAGGRGDGFLALTLTITHGPAAGKVFVADDPKAEYKIGRLPDCSLQILDQEISGRHASLRWVPAEGQWKLHDVGSLNGTMVGDRPIGRDYKVPGDEQPLGAGDVVTLGSVTRMTAALAPAVPRGAAATEAGTAAAAKRRHAASGPEFTSGSLSERLISDTVSGMPGLQGALPTPSVLRDYPQLGVRLCVHNQLGVDHKRMGQGCEDVPYWELPFEPYTGAGIVCVFDGHHGSKAANQAKEHVPAVLRAKLLRRDGRRAPPLPPPPPPPPKPKEEDEEEEQDILEEDEGYEGGDGDSGEDAEGAEGAGMEGAGAAPEGQGAGEDSEAAAEALQGPPQAEAVDVKAVVEEEASSPPPPPQGEAEQEAAEGSGRGDVEMAAEGGGAEDSPPPPPEEELVPPPPEGPPLPPFLQDRDIASQQALLKEVFLDADKYLSMEEGCTATVVLMEAGQGGWTFQSANVGDSSAVLVNFTRGTWSKLSEDHRIASSVSERQRLALRGHTVRTRLYGLNISRMLGDRFLKEEDLGFLAEPYVGTPTKVESGDHAVLVVASDGLWDVLPEERAARMLLQEAARPSSPSLTCQSVADLLLGQALALRSKDDITVTVLEMGPQLGARQGPA